MTRKKTAMPNHRILNAKPLKDTYKKLSHNDLKCQELSKFKQS